VTWVIRTCHADYSHALQHTCNALQHTTIIYLWHESFTHAAKRCNTLQRTATLCNIFFNDMNIHLHCNTPWWIVTHHYTFWHKSFTPGYSITCVTWLIQASLIYLTWFIHLCVMTLSHVRHDSLTCATILICTCNMTHLHVWHDSFICVTWLVRMRDMTHAYAWHDSFICFTYLIHLCDTTHSYMWHDSFICVTWLIHMCDMTHSYVWHDSFICVTW